MTVLLVDWSRVLCRNCGDPVTDHQDCTDLAYTDEAKQAAVVGRFLAGWGHATAHDYCATCGDCARCYPDGACHQPAQEDWPND